MDMIKANEKRKTMRLSPEQRRSFAKWVKNHITKKDAAEALGVQPFTVDRILITGVCSPETLIKIESVLAA